MSQEAMNTRLAAAIQATALPVIRKAQDGPRLPSNAILIACSHIILWRVLEYGTVILFKNVLNVCVYILVLRERGGFHAARDPSQWREE